MEDTQELKDQTESIQALEKILSDLKCADKIAKDLGELHYCLKLRAAMASIEQSIACIHLVLNHYKVEKKVV